MAISTPIDLITLALKSAGVLGVGQTALDEDVNDAFDVMNTLLAEWQLFRWLVPSLAEAVKTSTGAATYTVGSGGDFNLSGERPDKVDAVYARLISSSADSYLYPFMSREGYDRIATQKSAIGTPVSFLYDPGLGSLGTLYLYPVPDTTYSLRLNAKASLSQFTSLTQSLSLPLIYTNALLWNLAANLRPIYQMAPDPQVTARAEASLQAIINSVAQVPTAVQPRPSDRAGIFSVTAPANEGAPQ